MRKRYLYSFIVLLLASNIYFVFTTYVWQNEWLEQYITTFDVESMFKEQQGCLVTYKGLSQGENSDMYEGATPHGTALEYGADHKALLRGETLLYFKNGNFMGSSKAKLKYGYPWLLTLAQ